MGFSKFILFLAVTFLGVAAHAQKGQITGYVFEGKSFDGVPYANVALYKKAQNIPAFTTVTDTYGKYLFKNVSYGEYFMVVRFMGYKSDTTKDIKVDSRNFINRLEPVRLNVLSTELGEVTVSGNTKTSTLKIDKHVYRSSDFETAKGGTAVDVLSKLASVSVSPDGTVSLRNISDFMVYVNGRPTQMDPSEALRQISANTIENIDVITVPSARYEAQGKGGIININTKRTGQNGFSVKTSGLLGGAPWADFTSKYNNFELNDNRVGTGVNLNFQNENVLVYGGINLLNRNINGSRTGDARILMSDGTYYHMVASGDRPEWFKNFSLQMGVDYYFSETGTLSASYFYGKRTEGRSAFYTYNNFFGYMDKSPIPGIGSNIQWIYNPNTDERFGAFNSVNFGFNKKFGSNVQLNVQYSYEHAELSRSLLNQDFQFDHAMDKVGAIKKGFIESDNTPLDGHRFSLVLEKEFDNHHKLSGGYQPNVIYQFGAFNYDTLNIVNNEIGHSDKYSNFMNFKRVVNAFYADYTGSWGQLDAIFGLRLEQMSQVLNLKNSEYLNIFGRPTKPEFKSGKVDLFPTLHLKYGLKNNDALVFAASRRINRPQSKSLTPFLYRRHYEVYEVGDPELKPEYLTNVEVSFDKKIGNQGITLTGFYRGTDNAVFRVNTVYEAERVLIRSYTNSGNVKATGVELNGNFSAGKMAKFFIGGSLYNFKVQGDVFGYQENNQSTNWSLKGNMNLFFTKELKLTADFDLRSATVTTQGRNEAFFMTNAMLNYSPAKLKGWEFGLKALDLLSSNLEALNTRAYNAAGKQIFYQEVEYTRNGPILELSAVWSLNWKSKSGVKVESVLGKEQF